MKCCLLLHREKSATREAVEVLSEVISGLWEGNAPKFSIMKLPVRGIVLLLWQRGLKEPRPTAAVAEVITSIYAGKRNKLKSAVLAQLGKACCVYAQWLYRWQFLTHMLHVEWVLAAMHFGSAANRLHARCTGLYSA